MPPITTILFDCDNTLVLSEALAFEACADLANEIIAKYSPTTTFRYTAPELQRDFVGKNFRNMMHGMEEKFSFKIPDADFEPYVNRELGTVVEKLAEKAQECPGATATVARYAKEGKYKMAIVSTSAKSRILASIEKVGQDQYFENEYVFSAATSLDPPSSKPNPAVYHHACKVLGVKEGECVAIEDSKSGGTAAKNAKIPLIGYVGPYYVEDGAEKAKQMEKVLTEECGALTIMHDWKEFDACLEKVIKS